MYTAVGRVYMGTTPEALEAAIDDEDEDEDEDDDDDDEDEDG